jgi:hypothetical protein
MVTNPFAVRHGASLWPFTVIDAAVPVALVGKKCRVGGGSNQPTLPALRSSSRIAGRAGRAPPGSLKLLQFRDRPVQLAVDRRLVSKDLVHGLRKRSLRSQRLSVGLRLFLTLVL